MSETLKAIKEARDFTPCCHKAENVIGNIMVVTKENYDLQKELYDKAIEQLQQQNTELINKLENKKKTYNIEIKNKRLFEHHRYAKRQEIKLIEWVLSLLGDDK